MPEPKGDPRIYPNPAALRFAQGSLRCSIRRAAAQLAPLRFAQTVLADVPRQLCAARRLTRESVDALRSGEER